MPRPRAKSSSSIIPIFIVAAAISIWIYDAYKSGGSSSISERPRAEETRKNTTPNDSPNAPNGKSSGSQSVRTGNYETYRNCTLVPDRPNDGDSFRIKLPDGSAEIMRLYFVDCPESEFRSYGGGENNHERIEKQATEMGGITPAQAVKIGKNAKEFTLARLAENPFTVHTTWDSPFQDKRYHAFIELSYNGKTRFLHELLVEKGYARIHTKGAQLPNGTSERKHEDHLYMLQTTAKSKNAGAWGF